MTAGIRPEGIGEAAGADRTRAIIRALGSISRCLAAPDWAAAVNDGLATLGSATGVRRVFLFENDDDVAGRSSSLRYEWTSPGIRSALDDPALSRIATGPEFRGLGLSLDAGHAVVLRYEDVPPEIRTIFRALDLSALLVVPVFVDGERVGLIGFDTLPDSPAWGEEEIAALSVTADLLGAAIRHRRTIDSLRRRDAILEAVTFAAERFAQAASVDDAIGDVVGRLGVATAAARVALIARGDTGDGIPRMGIHAEWRSAGIAPLIKSDDPIGFEYFPRWAVELREGRLIRGQVRDFPPSERDHLLREEVRSILLAPIIVAGSWWGHIGFDDSRADRSWTEPEVEAVRAAAGIVGSAIEREKAALSTRMRGAILRAVGDSATVLLVARDLPEALLDIIRRLRKATDSTIGFVYEFETNAAGRVVGRLAAIDPLQRPHDRFGEEIVVLPSIEARLRAGDVFQDETVTERDLAWVASGEPLPADSWIALPILVGGDLWGAIGLDSADHRSWSAGEIDALRVATSAISAVVARGRADEALRESEERLRRAHQLDLVGRLAGGLAHDFGNVLQAILGHARFIVDGAHTTEEREDAQVILEHADRGAELVRELMAVSRRRVGEVVPVDLNALLDRLGRTVKRLAGADVTTVVQLDPSCPRVLGDEAQLEHLLVNLVTNARDAMPHGGTITLATAVAEAGRFGVLRVTDTGAGMDDATRARIFEPLFTTKLEGQGTGFGLATAESVVAQMSGRIDVETELGIGTTFSILLPTAPESADQPGSTQAGST